jgi:hypothetical protein
MASMASIAESAGSQDIEGFIEGPRAVECYVTPEVTPEGSPKDMSAKKAPLPIARV